VSIDLISRPKSMTNCSTSGGTILDASPMARSSSGLIHVPSALVLAALAASLSKVDAVLLCDPVDGVGGRGEGEGEKCDETGDGVLLADVVGAGAGDGDGDGDGDGEWIGTGVEVDVGIGSVTDGVVGGGVEVVEDVVVDCLGCLVLFFICS
jgi:hypothetical protein